MQILRHAFNVIKHHKLLFSFIILLQLLFFSSLGASLYTYSQEVVGSLNAVSNYLNSQEWLKTNPTEENLRELGIPSTDPEFIASEREKMLIATQMFFLKAGEAYILFCGLAWLLSYRMMHKHSIKELLNVYGKFVVVSLPYLAALSLLLYSLAVMITGQFLTLNAAQTYLFVLPLFFVFFLLYFMPVSFALVPATPLKESVQQTLRIGIRKCLFLFSMYGGALLLIGGLAVGMLLVMERSFLLSVFFGVTVLICITLFRILLLAGISLPEKES